MATEKQAQQFYVHKYHNPVYLGVQQQFERFIADVLFRQDLTRTVWASNEYAFRRRLDLLDRTNRATVSGPSSLNFPFMNYWGNGYFKKTNWSNAQMELYSYQGGFGGSYNLRAMGVEWDFDATFYFARDDDARFAYEKLLFMRHPTYNLTHLDLQRGVDTLQVPVIITLEDVVFNPQFKEQDWLDKHKVFTVVAKFKVKSFMLFVRDSGSVAYELTQKAMSEFVRAKDVSLDYPTDVTDMVEAVMSNDPVPAYALTVSNVTDSTAEFTYLIENEDPSNIINISFLLNNKPAYVITDPDLFFSGSYRLDLLTENTDYDLKLLITRADGEKIEVIKQFTTSDNSNTEEPGPNNLGDLKGMTW